MQLSTLDSTNGFAINGIDQNDNCGVSVSSAGDVNGDGVSDILIGADEAYPGERVVAGETYVVFGKRVDTDGKFPAAIELSSLNGENGFVLNGINTNDRSGFSVSSAGALNNDGVNDLVIGARDATRFGKMPTTGEVYVIYGRRLAADPCTLADVNDDGVVTPADFSAWVAAFNTMMPGCDQNGDSLCTPADFSAWVANYNSDCED